jgi:hypothetical protein
MANTEVLNETQDYWLSLFLIRARYIPDHAGVGDTLGGGPDPVFDLALGPDMSKPTIKDLEVGTRFEVAVKPNGFDSPASAGDTWIRGSKVKSGSWGYYDESVDCWNETKHYSRNLDSDREARIL